jgi:hypothetical protein
VPEGVPGAVTAVMVPFDVEVSPQLMRAMKGPNVPSGSVSRKVNSGVASVAFDAVPKTS